MTLQNIDAPPKSGIYLMKDTNNNVIYIGKAKNLKKRINSYFTQRDSRPQIAYLLKKLKGIDFIVTENEKEALILENNLIKKYKPRYNIQLKDDKNYLCIKIDMTKSFPRLEFVRRIKNDNAIYFGPYPSARVIRDVIHMVGKIFPLRRCSDRSFEKRKKPCLYFEMGECIAPCIDKGKKEEYDRIIKEVISFLRGNTKKVINMLEKKMWELADSQEYERAAYFRDLIKKISIVEDKQGVFLQKHPNIDAIGTFVFQEKINIAVLYVRGGRLTNKRIFTLPLGLSEEETLSQFLLSFYTKNVVPPDMILLAKRQEDGKYIEEELENHFNKKIKLSIPKDREAKRLIELANLNASSFFKDYSETEELRRILGIDREIKRIECFDASHMFGKLNLCSMVVYEKDGLAKDEYRLFNIDQEGYDDLRSIKEALKRRLNHKEWQYPDIIVIDGGKGQLNVAVNALKERNITDIYIIAFAKDENNSIYIPNRKNPIVLKKEGKALKILNLLRAEAHRFANRHLKKRIEKDIKEGRND